MCFKIVFFLQCIVIDHYFVTNSLMLSRVSGISTYDLWTINATALACSNPGKTEMGLYEIVMPGPASTEQSVPLKGQRITLMYTRRHT